MRVFVARIAKTGLSNSLRRLEVFRKSRLGFVNRGVVENEGSRRYLQMRHVIFMCTRGGPQICSTYVSRAKKRRPDSAIVTQARVSEVEIRMLELVFRAVFC
jgi:hypothetical protein